MLAWRAWGVNRRVQQSPRGCRWPPGSHPRLMNAAVIEAKTVRPNDRTTYRPPPLATITNALGSRRPARSARSGKRAMTTEAAAAALMAMVRTKSTIDAPIGRRRPLRRTPHRCVHHMFEAMSHSTDGDIHCEAVHFID